MDFRYLLRLIFWMKNQVFATAQASSIRCKFYFGWEITYPQPTRLFYLIFLLDRPQVYIAPNILSGKIGISNQISLKYLLQLPQLVKSKLFVCFYILGEQIGICDQPTLRYIAGFIFWIRKQIFATGQIVITSPVLYFWWKNMYLQPPRPQIYPWLYILEKKTNIFNRPGLKYTIFYIKNIIVIGNNIKNYSYTNLRIE